MNNIRSVHGCVTTPPIGQKSGQVLVVGGYGSENTIESLQIGSNQWRIVGTTAPLQGLYDHSVTLSHSPEYIAYSIGGYSSSEHPVQSIYGITSNYSFKKVRSLKIPRGGHTSLNLIRQDIPGCS